MSSKKSKLDRDSDLQRQSSEGQCIAGTTGDSRGQMSASVFRCLVFLTTMLSMAPYLATSSNGLLNWDDPEYLLFRPEIRSGFTTQSVTWAFQTHACANWHPFTWLSYIAEIHFFGFSTFVMHVTNIVLHGVNTCLVAFYVRTLTKRSDIAIFTACLFGIHPQHVEVVAWLSERKELLCCTFGLLTLQTWARFRLTGKIEWFVCSLSCFALSLLAKQMLMTLPFLLLVLEVCPLRDEDNGISFQKLFGGWKWTVPFFLMMVFFLVRVFQAQEDGGAISTIDHVPMWMRVTNATQSLVWYLAQTFVPVGLQPFYRHPLANISLPLTACCGAILLAAFVWVIANRNRPCVLAGSLWFLGTLVPVLGLVQLGAAARADRYMYFPHIGLFLVAGSWLPAWSSISGRRTVAGLSVIVLVFTIMTYRQTLFWKDSIALWTRCVDCDPGSYRGHDMLALSLLVAERHEDALRQARIALHYPENEQNGSIYTTIGCSLLFMGDLPSAITNLREAIRLTPNDFRALINLGYAVRETDLAEAHRLFTEALKYCPGNLEATANLANCEASFGNYRRAMELLKEAMVMAPDEPRLKENYRLFELALRNTPKP
jgi:hypothetical protein